MYLSHIKNWFEKNVVGLVSNDRALYSGKIPVSVLAFRHLTSENLSFGFLV